LDAQKMRVNLYKHPKKTMIFGY